MANDAVGGYTTTDVLTQLQSDAAVIDQVRTADVVEIEIGANDVAHSGSCGTSVACYEPSVPVVEKNLAAIVARVHELTTGRQVLVVLLDYWSVWLGGQYAAAQGDAYVTAAADVTDQVNTVIKTTASITHSAYVDLRDRVQGTRLHLRRDPLPGHRRRPPQRGRAPADRIGNRDGDQGSPPHLTISRLIAAAYQSGR